MRRALCVLASPLVLAACGAGEASDTQAAGELVAGTVLVLENGDHGPAICSLRQPSPGMEGPIPCDDIPVTNWDWAAVSGEKHTNGETSGRYRVTGSYEAGKLTVTAVEPPQNLRQEGKREYAEWKAVIVASCPEPAGGWVSPDPMLTSWDDLDALFGAVEKEPDFAGIWLRVDGIAEGEPEGPDPDSPSVPVLAFTGDLERHEKEAREKWGGPLCVVRREHAQSELKRIHNDLADVAADELGIAWYSIGPDELAGVVELGALVVEASAREALDARYGPGMVSIVADLEPVE